MGRRSKHSTAPILFQLGETTIPWDENYMRSYGFYAQDQWLIDRLSINAGVRFDYFRGFYPDHTMPETTWGAASSFPGAGRGDLERPVASAGRGL